MEDLSVYGYMTNTKVKFITVLTVPDVIIKDLDMKNVRFFLWDLRLLVETKQS